MISHEALFDFIIDPTGVMLVDINLSPDEQEIWRIVQGFGLDKSVFVAYMAESHPFNVKAPEWRGASGTRNGVLVSLFLHSIPEHDQRWIDVVNTIYKGEASPIDKVFGAWLRGDLLVDSFLSWPGFHQAASIMLETRIPQA